MSVAAVAKVLPEPEALPQPAPAGPPDPRYRELFTARVRADLQSFLGRPGKSQAQVAKKTGLSATVISQFISDSYRGDILHVAHIVDAFLILQVRRADILEDPLYVETRNATWIREGLQLALELCDIIMVYGEPGLGKTFTARQFQREHLNMTVFLTATRALRSPHAFMQRLAEEIKAPTGYGLPKLEKEIHDRLRNSGRLLIVDEAERLTFGTLETVQAIHDEARIGIAYLADEVLWRTVTAGRSRAEYGRFLSRVGIKRPISPAPEATDVTKIAVQFLGHTDEECISYLTAKAQGPGGFRAVVKHCRQACRLSRTEGRRDVTLRDLQLASANLYDLEMRMPVSAGRGR